MIKLKHLLSERFADEFPKKKWVNLDHSKADEYADELADLIINAYAKKGGNFEIKSGADLKASDISYWIATDLDDDPNPDAVVGGKPTPAGVKMTMMGQDGTQSAKRDAVAKMLELMKYRGFYAELDPDLASKLGLKHMRDPLKIRKILGKEIEYNSDGSYQRKITNGPVKTKVLVGIPKDI